MAEGASTAGPSSNPSGSASVNDPGQQAGTKRTATERDRSVSPSSSSDNLPKAKKARKGGKKKVKAQQYQLKRDQIPTALKGTKDAGYLHGYILFGMVRSDSAPSRPSASAIATFEKRYTPNFLQELQQILRTTVPHSKAAKMVAMIREGAKREAGNGSQIAKDILEIKETFLLSTYTMVLAAGLEVWCPDVLGAPDSLYNQVHETVFFESFRSANISYAYRIKGPTTTGTNNPALIRDIYLSFTYSYMRRKAQIELRTPGKLADNADEGRSRNRRARLAEKRQAFALKDKFPDRVLQLVGDERCNSDDDSGTDDDHKVIYSINGKSLRSASATSFIHKLEDRRIADDQFTRGLKRSNLYERLTYLFKSRSKPPIDCFDPERFNDFPAETRFRYAKYGVALPLLEHHKRTDWKTMSKAVFMEKYGNDGLKQYSIPSAEEMERQGNSGWEADEQVPMEE
ncbi:hypothetical protein R3P38DRAFT_2572359 [Favolaschia claudopus]|uniref:Uncharacterized protein n=1 Tax=Favolaschia claudopus TaxID=2862362 RepID=A0AAV9ZS89_9AGAR